MPQAAGLAPSFSSTLGHHPLRRGSRPATEAAFCSASRDLGRVDYAHLYEIAGGSVWH